MVSGVIVNKIKVRQSEALEIQKKKFQQEIELYKTNLKMSEFFFEKEYQASTEFAEIMHSIRPQKRHIEENWNDDACERIAENFAAHAKRLKQFDVKHGAILDKVIRQ